MQLSDSRRRGLPRPHPEPLRFQKRAASTARPEPTGRGSWAYALVGDLPESGAARPLEMEWHMKRLCQRCGVISDLPASNASRTLRPELDWKMVLLWRSNQRHRPPSKR